LEIRRKSSTLANVAWVHYDARLNRTVTDAFVRSKKMRSILIVFASVLATAGLLDAPAVRAASPTETSVVQALSLPDIPLASLPKSIQLENDRGILLGGFSDLWRASTDPKNEFWIVTDRGPNASPEIDGKKHRTFPVPDFTPLILHVRADRDRLKLLEIIPLTDKRKRPVTGLPNDTAKDGPSFSYDAKAELGVNPNGLDTEGMIRMPDGSFWLAEEYRPSIVKVSANGVVEKRLIPEGEKLDGATCEVADTLPAVYARRKENRGFEGLALSEDATILYAALQSPLSNPDEKSGEKSRNTRILAIDIEADRPAAEYVYQFDEAKDFDVGAKRKDMKIGGVAIWSAKQMLVLERTDAKAKIYAVDLSRATNLLATPHSSATGNASLERMDDLAKANIRPLPKKLVADLSAVAGIPEKLEGLAIVDAETIAVVNDNDFGFKGFDDNGRAISNGVKSELVLIHLPSKLPGR
jgi:hypothetical protein